MKNKILLIMTIAALVGCKTNEVPQLGETLVIEGNEYTFEGDHFRIKDNDE